MIIAIVVIVAIAAVMTTVAIIKKPRSVYKNAPEEQNPFEGKIVKFVGDEREPENADGMGGHLETVSPSAVHVVGFYEKFIKRGLDIILSFFALVVLSPLFLVLILAVVIDDPGPAFFVQKRVGKNKQFFIVNKFRTVGTHKNEPCLAA